jgi:AraC family transcriptional regulator
VAGRLARLQPFIAFAARHFDRDLSVAALARSTGLSPFHAHRAFAATLGETVKRYTLRLRLDHAASALLAGDDTILDIALASGFQSHETFCRAFQRRFGMTPSAYRRRGFAPAPSAAQIARHVELVAEVGPCIGLFQISEGEHRMSYEVSKRHLEPQPILAVRKRVKRTDIAAAIGAQLGRIVQHVQRSGAVIAGQPFTRHLEWGPGIVTIDIGLPVVGAVAGADDIRADELPGGPVATTTHMGAYDQLGAAHAALQIWIEDNHITAGGAPWEVYVTDPGEHPDPKDWKTELFWPLAEG